MEDIEDIAVGLSPERSNRSADFIIPLKNSKLADTDMPLPSVWVKTWGCSHNSSDAEYMAGLLAEHGFPLVKMDDLTSSEAADVWLLNSCTVKNPSEDAFMNAIRTGEEKGKIVVLSGCVPQADKKNTTLEKYSTIGVSQIHRVVEVIEEAMQGNTVRLLGTGRRSSDSKPPLLMPKIRRNKFIEIIPINSGCLNQCTYCKTKHSRGDLLSYTIEEITQRVRDVLTEGVVEIWLSSEDTGAYGRDIGQSLPNLLKSIVNELPHHVRLRIGMTNPPYILEHLKEVAEIMKDPRVYKFLHLPVQAASNRVLEEMRRQYSKEDFSHVVEFLRSHVPGINIATDIICGFPGETAEEFEETLALVDTYKFPALHISQFYPRKGTPAARMKRVPTAEVKRRSREMTKLFNSYETLQDKVGKTFRVLCTDIATDKAHFVAHNEFFDQILVPMDDKFMGKMFEVRITFASKFYLIGEPIEGSLFKDNDFIYTIRPNQPQKPSHTANPSSPSSPSQISTPPKPHEIINKTQILYLAIGSISIGMILHFLGY